jgi:ribosomal protein S18 acetylase RimI-like enzyme
VPDQTLLIRPATAADGEAILNILMPVIRAGETYALPRDMKPAAALAYWTANETFVAEAAADIIGTYYLRPNQQGGGAHVANCGFMTRPGATGKGIGAALCDHALHQARRSGFTAMQFNFVIATNAPAIRLWQRFGFDILARLPEAFIHPLDGAVDALVMFRKL